MRKPPLRGASPAGTAVLRGIGGAGYGSRCQRDTDMVAAAGWHRGQFPLSGTEIPISRSVFAAGISESPRSAAFVRRKHLAALAALEKENCPSIDRAADTFAQLLAACAGLENEERKHRVLREMLYHLGRWIYLVDAADDLKKDIKSGSYNPLSLRYEVTDGALSAEDRENLSQTLDGSIRTMAAAFELADFGCWRTIIESVVYEGLYVVGAAVLNGTFHRQKQERADRNPTRKAGT